MRPGIKKTLLVAGKILVAVVLLWYVFTRKIDPAAMWEEIRQADPFWLILAFLANFSVIFLAVWRWSLLLLTQGIPTRFYPVFWATCAGWMFNSFMLGLTGGDIARVYYATQLAPSRKVGAALSVAVDRLVGLFGLLLLAGLVVTFFGHRFWAEQAARTAVIAILAAMAGAIVLVFLFLNQGRVAKLLRVESWLHRLPLQGVIGHLRQINAAYRNDRPTLVKTILISVGVHLVSILVVLLIGRSLGLNATPVQYYMTMPIINGITAIPISPGGAGVRENMFLIMFNAVGIDADTKVTAMSVLYFGIIILTSLAAGVFYMFTKPAVMHHDKLTEILETETDG